MDGLLMGGSSTDGWLTGDMERRLIADEVAVLREWDPSLRETDIPWLLVAGMRRG